VVFGKVIERTFLVPQVLKVVVDHLHKVRKDPKVILPKVQKELLVHHHKEIRVRRV
jgi:hypothetical protein